MANKHPLLILKQNALGDYTNIVISSYLPSMTVRKRLTPSLGTTYIATFESYTKTPLSTVRVVPWVIDELRNAFDVVLADCNGKVIFLPNSTYRN